MCSIFLFSIKWSSLTPKVLHRIEQGAADRRQDDFYDDGTPPDGRPTRSNDNDGNFNYVSNVDSLKTVYREDLERYLPRDQVPML
jgi:hypothetical protein